MKKNILFLLAPLCLLLCGLSAKASETHFSLPAGTPPCNLPAPSNLQYTQPGNYTVQFTWDPVPGAVGYRGVLTNLSNGSQSVSVGVPPNFLFPVTPGDDYEFVVAAMCSLDPPETSSQRSQVNFRAKSIIIEVIIKFTQCTTGTLIYESPTTSNSITYNWIDGQLYYFELIRLYPSYENLWLAFRRIYDEEEEVYKYELGEFSNNEDPSVLCGKPSSTSAPPPPLCGCSTDATSLSNAKFTYDDKTCRISFPSINEIHYTFNLNCPGEQPFDSFRIYEGCGGGRSDQYPDLSETAMLQVRPVNPFSDNLTLQFAKMPDEPIQTRLFDLQGILKTEAAIEPGQAEEGIYSLPTENLPPGMYFLQVETRSGQAYTQKLLKI